ncbi:MAG TPA: hypothetical protein VLA34_13490, partial [Candidatus Krumholzibacterium sp.]|nr:hypothetical protein [Candidatus Krumholzibacterium sp.]
MELKRSFILAAAIAAFLVPAISSSGRADAGSGADKAVSVFTGESRFDLDAFKSRETLRMGGRRLDSPVVSTSDMRRSRLAPPASRVRPGGKKKIAIAAIASAVLPG